MTCTEASLLQARVLSLQLGSHATDRCELHEQDCRDIPQSGNRRADVRTDSARSNPFLPRNTDRDL